MDDKSKIGLPHPLFLLGRPQFDGDMGKMGGCIASKSTDAADEIKQLHARIKELEAMLDAVGAGGVSAQRITQAKDHIAQDSKMVAAPVELNLDDYYCKGCINSIDDVAQILLEHPTLNINALRAWSDSTKQPVRLRTPIQSHRGLAGEPE